MSDDDSTGAQHISRRSGEYEDTYDWRRNVDKKLDKIVESLGTGSTAIALLIEKTTRLERWQDNADTDNRSTALGIKLCVITSIVGPSIAILFTIFHK